MKQTSLFMKRLLFSLLALTVCLCAIGELSQSIVDLTVCGAAAEGIPPGDSPDGQAIGDPLYPEGDDSLTDGQGGIGDTTSDNPLDPITGNPIGVPMEIPPPVDRTGTVDCWVEKPNITDGVIENGDDPNQFMFFKSQQGEPEPYLTTPSGKRFAHLLETKTMEDGSVVAFYARGVFTYAFDVFTEIGEMTIGGITYKADDPYMIQAKYEQLIVFPGLENGMMPKNVDSDLKDAYCAGWALDERTGDDKLLTYAGAVTEDMLPTDDMPYENLTFHLTAVWYDSGEKYVLSSWYEELPQDAAADANRKSYSGKVYVNYSATDFELVLPKGTRPGASDALGLTLVAQIAPDASKPYPEGSTWYFVYDRKQFTLTLHSGIMESQSFSGIPYQQNLAQYDPGLNETTMREADGEAEFFAGWHQEDVFVGYSLNELYMTPYDLLLEGRWERR